MALPCASLPSSEKNEYVGQGQSGFLTELKFVFSWPYSFVCNSFFSWPQSLHYIRLGIVKNMSLYCILNYEVRHANLSPQQINLDVPTNHISKYKVHSNSGVWGEEARKELGNYLFTAF